MQTVCYIQPGSHRNHCHPDPGSIPPANLRALQWGYCYCHADVLLAACSLQSGSIGAPLGPLGWGPFAPSPKKTQTTEFALKNLHPHLDTVAWSVPLSGGALL